MSTGTKTRKQDLEAKAVQRVATREEILAKKPRSKLVPVVLDDEPLFAHDAAVERLEAARRRKAHDDVIKRLEADVEAAARAVEAVTVNMVFRSVGNKRYDAIREAHPPLEEEVTKAKEENVPPPAWNTETFIPAIVHASLAEPELSFEEVKGLIEGWNVQETLVLFNSALEVNTVMRRVAELGKDFG